MQLRDEGDLTIDFLPPQEIRGLRTRVIGEETIVAMETSATRNDHALYAAKLARINSYRVQ
jgi:hypothetical protein